MNKEIDQIRQELAHCKNLFNQLKKSFDYQNNRFAKEFLQHKDRINEISEKIDSLKNEINKRFDHLVREYKRLDDEGASAIAGIKRLTDKLEEIERR